MSGIDGAHLLVTDTVHPYPTFDFSRAAEGPAVFQELQSEGPISSYNDLELEERAYLFTAVECGNQGVVSEKLARDSNRVYYVHSDIKKDTLLHIAAMNAHREVLQILIHYGAVVNIINANGDTPLHCAAFARRNVRYLIENGAINSLNVKNTIGFRPLDISILLGVYKNVKFLLSAGAICDYADKRGNTPLHYAAEIVNKDEESEKIVELLLRHGLRATKKNNQGLIPLEVAANNNNIGAAKAMLESSQRDDIKKYLKKKHNWDTIDHASAWEVIEHAVIKQMVKDLIQER